MNFEMCGGNLSQWKVCVGPAQGPHEHRWQGTGMSIRRLWDAIQGGIRFLASREMRGFALVTLALVFLLLFAMIRAFCSELRPT